MHWSRSVASVREPSDMSLPSCAHLSGAQRIARKGFWDPAGCVECRSERGLCTDGPVWHPADGSAIRHPPQATGPVCRQVLFAPQLKRDPKAVRMILGEAILVGVAARVRTLLGSTKRCSTFIAGQRATPVTTSPGFLVWSPRWAATRLRQLSYMRLRSPTATKRLGIRKYRQGKHGDRYFVDSLLMQQLIFEENRLTAEEKSRMLAAREADR